MFRHFNYYSVKTLTCIGLHRNLSAWHESFFIKLSVDEKNFFILNRLWHFVELTVGFACTEGHFKSSPCMSPESLIRKQVHLAKTKHKSQWRIVGCLLNYFSITRRPGVHSSVYHFVFSYIISIKFCMQM
jgi:hypothetical protein